MNTKEREEFSDTPNDEELLCMVLSRVEPIVETVRAIRGLALSVSTRLEARSDQHKDAVSMIVQCSTLISYLEPLQNAAHIQAWYGSRAQECFLDAKKLH